MKTVQMPLANIDRDIDRAWKETHLAAQHFVRAGSDDAARRYNIAFGRLQELIKQRMTQNGIGQRVIGRIKPTRLARRNGR